MKIGVYLRVAMENMAQNKLRTSLTLLGLIVGISSVLLMTGLGRGFQKTSEEMLSSLLPNKLTLQRGYSRMSSTSSLTANDAKLLSSLDDDSAIAAVTPTLNLYDVDVKGFNSSDQQPQIMATTTDYEDTETLVFAEGRFFTEEEAANDDLVIVVNEAFRDTISSDPDLSNLSVYINNKRFTIVGVISDSETFGYSYPTAYIPINLLPYPLYSRAVELVQGSPVVDSISVLSTNVDTVSQAQEEVEMMMRLSHGLQRDEENDFMITADNMFLDTIQDSSRIFTYVLGGIGAISLVVSGIGIMNIMLATITERTREIGIRKAVGAKDSDILFQFLMEAVAICLIGALVSVMLSYGLAAIISSAMQSGDLGGMRVIIDIESVLIASLCGSAAGIIFGLYPSVRAMRLDPIEALHSE